MSYDLTFIGDARLGADDFAAYFTRRPRYTVSASQAWYEHEDTGVYFAFEWPDSSDSAEFRELQAETPGAVAWCTINLCRPSFFALEAEPEIRAFTRAFALQIADPQASSEPESFDGTHFRRRWSDSNRSAIRAMQAIRGTEPDFSRPASVIETVWRWNFHRQGVQAQMGDDVYVPPMFFVHAYGRCMAATFWPDGIATLVPRAEAVLIARDELARGDSIENALLSWPEIEAKLQRYGQRHEPSGGYVFRYKSTPRALRRWIQGLAADESLVRIPADQVLDAEATAGAGSGG